jgi:hypothetical protein
VRTLQGAREVVETATALLCVEPNFWNYFCPSSPLRNLGIVGSQRVTHALNRSTATTRNAMTTRTILWIQVSQLREKRSPDGFGHELWSAHDSMRLKPRAHKASLVSSVHLLMASPGSYPHSQTDRLAPSKELKIFRYTFVLLDPGTGLRLCWVRSSPPTMTPGAKCSRQYVHPTKATHSRASVSPV